MYNSLTFVFLVIGMMDPMPQVVDRSSAETTLDYAISLLRAEKYQQYFDELVAPDSRRELHESGEDLKYLESLKKLGPDLLRGYEAARQSKPIEKKVLGRRQTIFKVKNPKDVFMNPKDIFFEEVILKMRENKWYFAP